MARATGQLSAAEAIAAQVTGQILDAAARDPYARYVEQVEMCPRAGWIVETITPLINDLVTAHGSVGFAESALIQRISRDKPPRAGTATP